QAQAVETEPWLDPIDTGYVVDDNNMLPAEGLACRATATVDGEILIRFPVGSQLQVVQERIYDGNQSSVQVNCVDGSGFVNGDYVILDSEQAPDPEPATEPQDQNQEADTP